MNDIQTFKNTEFGEIKSGVALSTLLAASRRPAKIETPHKIITALGVRAEDIMKEELK